MNGDERLRQAFRELRDDDARGVPPFSRTAGAPEPRHARTWLPLAAAAALVVALGLGALVLPKLHRRPAVDPQQWTALTQWHAATDSLLDEPETPWSGPMGSTTDSLLGQTRPESQ